VFSRWTAFERTGIGCWFSPILIVKELIISFSHFKTGDEPEGYLRYSRLFRPKCEVFKVVFCSSSPFFASFSFLLHPVTLLHLPQTPSSERLAGNPQQLRRGRNTAIPSSVVNPRMTRHGLRPRHVAGTLAIIACSATGFQIAKLLAQCELDKFRGAIPSLALWLTIHLSLSLAYLVTSIHIKFRSGPVANL